MFIDKKGNLFGKINIIDLCVVLIIIAAVAVTAIKFKSSNKRGAIETNAKIEYTIKVSDVREFTGKQFKQGDSIYDNETGKFIGKIASVSKKQHKEHVLKTDGTYSLADKQKRFDVFVTIQSTGTVNDTGYYAEGIRQISPHATIIVSNNKIKTTSTVERVAKK